MAIRRLVIAFGALVALAVVAHGVYWWIIADEVRNGIAAWVEERRAAGWTISHAALTIDGYPTRVRAVIDDPKIAIPGAAPGNPVRWRWRSNRLRLELQSWKLREIMFSIIGHHRVYTFRGERHETYEATLGSASGQARIASDGRMESIVLDVGAVKASRPGTPEILRVGRLGLTLFMPERSDDAAENPTNGEPTGPVVSASVENIVLPKEAHYPMGRTVQRVAITAKLIGDLALATTLAKSLSAWRDAGGTMEVRRVDIVWGKFNLSGEGTVALDGALQPIVAMTARIKGYRETVDALVETGFVRGRNALTTKLVLGFIARASPGGKSQLTVPLSIQNRILSAGPARVIKVPTINWDTVRINLK